MKSDYPNIRYHIYRELSKYQQTRKEERSTFVDDISIPIFSSITSSCLADYIGHIADNIIVWVAIMAVSFIIIMTISTKVVRFYRCTIKPYMNPLDDQSRNAQKKEEDGLAAKFNYEVTYLVSTAYTEILSKEGDVLLNDLKILDVCFYINNAIRKIQESLMGYPYPLAQCFISPIKIKVVMDIVYATIKKLNSIHDIKSDYKAEIDRIQIKYDKTSKRLSDMYHIELKTFAY